MIMLNADTDAEIKDQLTAFPKKKKSIKHLSSEINLPKSTIH